MPWKPYRPKYEIGQKVTNAGGAWVRLEFDPNGGTHYQGVWYAVIFSPCFKVNRTAEIDSHRDRAKIERRMTAWLANRPLTAEQIEEFDREHGL